MNPRFAILLDGGFVTKALNKRNGTFPAAADVVPVRRELQVHTDVVL
jgi:hypothetical protein